MSLNLTSVTYLGNSVQRKQCLTVSFILCSSESNEWGWVSDLEGFHASSKALRASKTETKQLLGGTKRRKSPLMRAVDLPSWQINDFFFKIKNKNKTWSDFRRCGAGPPQRPCQREHRVHEAEDLVPGGKRSGSLNRPWAYQDPEAKGDPRHTLRTPESRSRVTTSIFSVCFLQIIVFRSSQYS